jgi:ABC-type branched-subunit amino acid transport system substrate-binding protein
VAGRKMRISDCDDGWDVTRFRACYRKLVDNEKIFAFITSATVGTGEVHADLARDRIPWFGSWGFFTSEAKDPWMFPTHAATIHEAHAAALWVKEVHKPKTVGILYWNVPEEKLAAKAIREVLEPAGIKVVRELPQELETTDESSNVLAMRSVNPDHILAFTHPAPNVKFMLDAANQGYWPPKGMTTNHTITEAWGSLAGEWPLQGLWSITTVKTWGQNDEYVATMNRYAPQMRDVHHHITQTAYAGVRTFVEAARMVGPNLTRTEVMKVLESKPWDYQNLLGQTYLWQPGNHDQLRCEYMYKYSSTKSGSYKVWEPDPTKHQICDTFD